MRNLIFELLKKVKIFILFILLIIYLFISLNPIITNVNDSILFLDSLFLSKFSAFKNFKNQQELVEL